MIDPLLVCHRNRAGHYLRLQPTIGVGKKEPLACGGLSADMAGVTLAQPTFRQHVHAFNSDPRILLGYSPKNVGRSIARAIINDEDLQVDALLREQATDCLFYSTFFITRGDHH